MGITCVFSHTSVPNNYWKFPSVLIAVNPVHENDELRLNIVRVCARAHIERNTAKPALIAKHRFLPRVPARNIVRVSVVPKVNSLPDVRVVTETMLGVYFQKGVMTVGTKRFQMFC